MPAPIEITDPLVVVRDLADDESLVVTEFEEHAIHCRHCSNAVETLRDGRSLCDQGNAGARTLIQYIHSRNGKYYSVVDAEAGKSTRVKLPRDAYSVRNLLTAIEQGLRLRSKPVIVQNPVQVPSTGRSYDRTYPIPARRVSSEQVRPRSMSPETYQIIERTPRSSRSPASIMYRSPGGSSPSRPSSSRGSLYNTDRQERVERQYEAPRRYVEGGSKYHR
ncbi:hypothetical protein PENANT_c030G05483 [Penicillium antarcticum]|uniref:Uncharacterized protein n=1 Tax=Penicillium antarcticum TaxID=416450 RepID=A0A1V6PVV9_9EURO|nr:uncharacterized protein N7508_001544 [Penicillium antarcticum]KAJ5317036.1 hypothetical protein N7508_001544 [Penicillium antarcticum]OQD81083.1 hypothetical protein PENANT_c030G05483 [Penicillium antarcticum]